MKNLLLKEWIQRILPALLYVGWLVTIILILIFLYLTWRRAAPVINPIVTPTTIPAVTPLPSATFWRPTIGASFQWQLANPPIDETVDAAIYDLDLFETEPALIDRLHAAGRRVICYINVGAFESYRSDLGQFPEEILGKVYQGYPDERWLDIRQIDRLAPIMQARFDLCQTKGFDAIEPDNIDGWQQETGFPLTASDQLRYNRWLANEAHARGLSIGLKNDPDQLSELISWYDWAITEDCFAQGWCDQLRPFIDANKAVITVEYTDEDVFLNDICQSAVANQFSAVLKHRDLDAWRESCQ